MDIPAIILTLQNATLFSEALLPIFLILALVAMQVTDRGAILLPSLLVVYLFVGITVSYVAMPHVAFSVWVVGIFGTIILYLAIRRIVGRTEPKILLQERGYRILIGLALGIVTWLIGFFLTYPAGSALISTCVWALLLLGSLRFFTAKRGMEIGIALLVILSGAGLWMTAVNNSPLIPGVWAVATIFLALVTSWLTDRTEGQTQEPALSS
ncbi:MAG: hypothetical protein AAF902_24845 [Chloroflexota bacterium]